MAKVLERSLYQTDYYAWTKQQAAALRALAAAGVDTTLDLENLAEGVESLGRTERATVLRELRRIIGHLLKLEHSRAAEPRFDWRGSVIEARYTIEDTITATLRCEVEASLAKIYLQGRRSAAFGLRNHGERDAADALPADCPYGFEQIVSQDWYPHNRHGLVDEI